MEDACAELAIGQRIKRLRNGLMTQDDLAAAAGVSTDVIRKLEQGRRHTASIASLHRIAAALDVDLGELLGRERMPNAAPAAGVVALRQAVSDVADLLGDVEGEPLSLRDAERSITYLWGHLLVREVRAAHRVDPASSHRTARDAARRRHCSPAEGG